MPTAAVTEPLVSPAPAAAIQPAALVLEPAEQTLYAGLARARSAIAQDLQAEQDDPTARIPLFYIVSNAALRALARCRPATAEALLQVPGFGPVKAARFGERFLAVLHQQAPGLGLELRDADGVDAVRPKLQVQRPEAQQAAEAVRAEVFAGLDAGCTLEAIRAQTGRTRSAIERDLVQFVKESGCIDPEPWVDSASYERILATVARVGGDRLKPVFEALGGTVGYGAIHVALAVAANRQRAKGG